MVFTIRRLSSVLLATPWPASTQNWTRQPVPWGRIRAAYGGISACLFCVLHYWQPRFWFFYLISPVSESSYCWEVRLSRHWKWKFIYKPSSCSTYPWLRYLPLFNCYARWHLPFFIRVFPVGPPSKAPNVPRKQSS